ncbi:MULTISPECIES: RNase adapter RapZ [Bacillota]|uniref:GlmZ(SRNA)-inactivating NTPase n=1 Tax=Virgibacillus pantothenticus TaxID=1473 RepID=A0A0L0QNF8_VIRPA|nr:MULTISPECIES: RNase adapter RapZ [Bacillota]API93476.1 RNase adaptor protein RapZ [Virgibacillus sp. 6R]KNE19793.1 glmZ(sRNA)-inactivating NTPase [Virgibacillus pantothenticus]MBS7430138.1 RNase adapter RapZ [Virgibacillus sp. 19R1-5]MBU8566304.1 RNase adapter RapZ [Virgibacillus pantothenticus]MBU8600727.1 RNase adapter RapZ [Virgibacillus pantothenticus]
MSENQETKLVIITGMSGAGKTVAVQSFEDLGYYCVDNLPPTLLPKFIDLMKDSTNNIQRVALVMDLRAREFFDSLFEALDVLADEEWLDEHVLFLDAKDEKLVSRYKETRRSHPLAVGGLPLNGIRQEREILDELRGRAQRIIDTTNLKPKELREKIVQTYSEEDQEVFSVHMVSFGFKYGLPIDADLVFDVRFLPNPHYVTNLQPLTGLNKDVSSYVFRWTDTQKFMAKVLDLLQFMLPQYKKEGKSQLVVAIGCTGGQHRSVALAEYFAKELQKGYITHVTHRDIDKRKGH